MLSKSKVAFLLTMIIVAGGVLRFVNLGQPSFWVDELNSFYTAESVANGGEMTLPSGLGYDRAPLQIYLTALLFKVMPANELSTRLPVLLFGLLSIWMVYMLAARAFNTRVGLLASFFMAFSHFEIGWSRTARMYTLLQFLALVFVYFIVRFMETRHGERMQAILWVEGEAPHIRLKHFIRRWGLSFGWLAPAVIIFGVAYRYVHPLAVFLPVGLLGYLAFMAFIAFWAFQGKERWLNKYSLLLVAGVGAALVAVAGVPAIRQAIPHFFHYTPPWAAAGSAANRLMLFDFLMSPYRFPLAALFFIGAVQAFFRFHRRGILTVMLFAVPLVLLSFLFTHRTPTYLFYVYPLFLILAAYGAENIVEVESRVSTGILKRLSPPEHGLTVWFQRRLTVLIPIVFAGIFLISPWLRISMNICRLPDGVTNGAVTPAEWRGAMAEINARWRQGDLVISSLPVTSLYYGRSADYCLNWSLLRQAEEKKSVSADGRWVDVYAGVPCLESIDALQDLIETHAHGWIAVEQYHWNSGLYIPQNVKAWVENRLGAPSVTPQGTMLVFHWSASEGR